MIPLFVPLAVWAGGKEPRDTVVDRVLRHKLDELQIGNRLDDAMALLRQQRLVIILDGYDEVGGAGNVHEEFGLAKYANAKIVISARTQFIHGDKQSYAHRFVRPRRR